uniref:Neuromedin U n=1 Tax=Chelonoidis abingdonii TaxID=106734 RepID=A0A8C0HCX3_CHEAB
MVSLSLFSGVPVPSQELQAEQGLQLWNEIDDACSAYLSIIEPHPETSSALEELCFMVMGFLQKPQVVQIQNYFTFLKDHFQYTNCLKLQNKLRIQSSILHPLLQLVPQLHERRLKRYKADAPFPLPQNLLGLCLSDISTS